MGKNSRSPGFVTMLRTGLAVALAFLAGSSAAGAASNGYGPPVVIVYPLTASGGVPPATGADIATLLATKLAEGNAIVVRPYTPGTTRAQYLEAAVAAGADYYVSGFLQPLGPDVSMVAQVVSTQSGSVVFSTTAAIRTFGDVAAQADPLHVAIVRHAGRTLSALDAPPPPPAPSPVATKGGAGVDLTRALRRRSRQSPQPSPSPSGAPVAIAAAAAAATARPPSAGEPPSARPSTPASAPPAPAASVPTQLVLDVGGTESPADRGYAGAALTRALAAKGVRTAQIDVEESAGRRDATALCRANAGTSGFIAPTLVLGSNERGAPSAQLTVAQFDCTGATTGTSGALGSGTSRSGTHGAIDQAIAKIVPAMAHR